MKSSGVKLSLKSWPTSPIEGPLFKVSPVSSKVVRKAGLTVKSILPLSEQNFFAEYDMLNKSEESFKEIYAEEMKRRRLKVKILRDLWVKAKAGKNQKHSQKKQGVRSKTQSLTEVSPRSHNSLSFNYRSPTNQDLSKIQTKKNSAYQTYYSYHKLPYLRSNSKIKEKSKKRKRSVKQKKYFFPNTDYYNEKMGRRKPVEEEKREFEGLIEEMNKTMENWTALDRRHHEELREMKNLTDRERKRLLKIHRIEKEKLREQIEEIRLRLL